LAVRRFCETVAFKESAMPRALWTATLLALTVLAGCKTRPADPPPAARSTEPARTAAPAPALPDSPRPADPPAAPPAPPAAAQPPAAGAEAEARSIATMQQLADTLAADIKDCEKLAVDLKAFIADHRPLLRQLIAAAEQPAGRAAAANHAAASAAARTLQSAMTVCAGTSSVAAAMKELPAD
jgi:hypothetical protein